MEPGGLPCNMVWPSSGYIDSDVNDCSVIILYSFMFYELIKFEKIQENNRAHFYQIYFIMMFFSVKD